MMALSYKEQIQRGESIQQEFKSDRTQFSEKELAYECAALANTEGGVLWLGVENDGTVTGLHPNHRKNKHLALVVLDKTTPSLDVHGETVEVDGLPVLRLEVARARETVGTRDGRFSRRKMKVDGTPETVPMTPYEIQQRAAYFMQIDPSELLMKDIPLSAINPLQRERLRAAIRRNNNSDKSLLALSDSEFDAALELVRETDGQQYLTRAGALFLTSEDVLREYVPTHEVAFQVLHNTDVLVNEYSHKPLLEVFEDFELRFKARIEEQEFMDGLFRVRVPNYDLTAFREAFVNALVHRDYCALGTVIIKLDDSGLTISNPGGFVEGISPENLLTAAPKARNRLLVDITKRLGLAERTGRGIDRIYEGLLRYGRPAPDYSQTTSSDVYVFMGDCKADFQFLKLILEQETKLGRSLPLDSLIIMSALRMERRLSSIDLAQQIQKPVAAARSAVEKLMEQGLVEAHGTGRGRTYTLSKSIYKTAGKIIEYVNQKGIDQIQQIQLVLNLVEANGSVTRGQVMKLCHLNEHQAYYLLRKMVKQGKLCQRGKRRNAVYLRPDSNDVSDDEHKCV